MIRDLGAEEATVVVVQRVSFARGIRVRVTDDIWMRLTRGYDVRWSLVLVMTSIYCLMYSRIT